MSRKFFLLKNRREGNSKFPENYFPKKFLRKGCGVLKIIVGISGASGAIMGCEFLKALREHGGIETHLIITEGAATTFKHETNLNPDDVKKFADEVYRNRDMSAKIASGSFRTDGLVIIPCSMKTVAGIASGFAENLLLRAADVCLKENRKIILVPREMPLSPLHLRNLKTVADFGCAIIPPVLTFYNHADTVEKQIQHIIGKIFSQLGLEYKNFVAWQS